MCDERKTAIIFMGIPGSGKTYYFNRYFAGKYEHINLDTLRTRKNEQQKLQVCMDEGRCLVIDNTNPIEADRHRYIPVLKAAGYRIIGYFFESRVKDCIRRNSQRTGRERIPDTAIAAISNKLQKPSKSEGFDELYFVKREGETDMICEEWREKDEV